MDSGLECTLSKFADNTKQCDVISTLEGWDAIQRASTGLRGGLARTLRFSKARCKVLNLGKDSAK